MLLARAARTERRRLPPPKREKALDCPRCNSADTKFCCYSSYSLRRPRYFCKACRRYWTEDFLVRGDVRGKKRRRHSPVLGAVPANGTADDDEHRRLLRASSGCMVS